jgi:hypothetical protein
MDREEGEAELLADLDDKSRFFFGVEVYTCGFYCDDERGMVIYDYHGVIIAKGDTGSLVLIQLGEKNRQNILMKFLK